MKVPELQTIFSRVGFKNGSISIMPQPRAVILGVFLVLLGFGVYINSFPGTFIVDDIFIVERNPLVHSLDLGTIFTSDYWGSGKDRGVYRPITILSFALNRLLLGEAPGAYHLINVLLHVCVGLVFFQLLRSWEISHVQSFCAAALFAVHPIHTEVVNEAVGRSELLVALFFLQALILAQSDRVRNLWLAALFYLLALLSKEHAITFLAAVFLRDSFCHRRYRERLPFYGGLLVITCAWLLFRQFGVDHGTMGRSPFYPIYSPLAFMPENWRILTALKLQLVYFAKLLWPFGLQGVYSGPDIDLPVKSLFSLWGGMIGMAVLATAALAYHGWRKQQLYCLAILLYVASFSVTSNIVFPIEVAFAERFAYLPSLWFCLLVVELFSGQVSHLHGRIPSLAACGFVVILGLSAWLTLVRNYAYRSEAALFLVDFEKNPHNVLAGMFLGGAYIRSGDYVKAEFVYREILKYRSDQVEILEDLAWSLVRQKRPQEAVSYALNAVKQRPNELSVKVLMILGECFILLDQPEEVLRWLDLMPPGTPPGFFWELRGKAYERLGDLPNATACYFRVGEPPLNSDVPYRLEQLLRLMGDENEAKRVGQWIQSREKLRGVESK